MSRFTTSWLEAASKGGAGAGAGADGGPSPLGGDIEAGGSAGFGGGDDGGGESASFLPSFVRSGASAAGGLFSGLTGGAAAAAPPPPEWACGLSLAQRLQVGGVLALGAAVLFSAALFVFLPMVLLFPGKFAAAFSAGSLLAMAAMALVRGPRAALLGLLDRERLAFSAAYLGSLALTLYAALASASYFLVVFAVACQVAALLWYAATFIPGGTSGMSFVSRMLLSSALSGARGAFAAGTGGGAR